MNRFWTDVIEPLARALEPKIVVEIGSDEGAGTEKLLRFCQDAGAVLHVIDPLPSYDVATWRKQWGDLLVYHQKTSLDALPALPPADLVLVDGDHNWYTVRGELEAIHRTSVGVGATFPLVLLHDVEWPYGRRDLYYDPETVPKADRQAYANAGMLPDQSELKHGGGYNPHRFNAIQEGGARNGVRTAVDDFIADHAADTYRLIVLPVLFGLGILYRTTDPRPSALERVLEDLSLDPRTQSLLRIVERERVAALIEEQEKGRQIDALEARVAGAEQTLKNDQAAMADFRNNQIQANAERAAAQGDAAAARSQLAAAQEQIAAVRAQLAQATDRISGLEQGRVAMQSENARLQERWSAWETSRTGRLVLYLQRWSQHHPRAYKIVRLPAMFALATRRKFRALLSGPNAL